MSKLFHARKSHAGALLLLGPISIVFAGFGISSASAATPPSVINNPANAAAIVALATTHTSQFCGFAENAQKTSITSAATGTPKSLAADFAKLKAEEPAVIAASPSQIRGDFQTLFNYFNKFYQELASVKYNYLKVSPLYLESLAKSAGPVEKASKAIQAYLVKTCGIKG